MAKYNMQEEISEINIRRKSSWNFLHLFIALTIAIILQSIFLPCLCWEGTVNLIIALVFDVLIVTRIVIAYLLHEKNKGWIFYCILCYLSTGMILIGSKLFYNH